MEIEFREAILDDAEGIVEIMKKGIESGSWKYTVTDKFDEDKLSRIKKRFENGDKKVRYYVAYDKELKKVAGSSSFGFNSERMKHKIELGWNVHPDYFGNGIATKLVSYVLDELKNWN